MTNRVTAAEIRQFIERVERLEAERKEASDAITEVYAEAKGRGYDAKVLRKVVSRRKRDRDDLAEEDSILDIYESVLGAS